jgi:DNA primase catalytic core
MARIPADELERLKAEVSVERLVESAGIELKPAGKDLLGRCPFHEDREASLIITPSKNLWHCFGCQIGGGPVDWMMKMKGVSFRHAVELLREGTLELPPARHGRIRVLSAPVSLDADDQALLAQAIDYYHERLKCSPEAISYLAKRGINDASMIERFKIGFADRTLARGLQGSAKRDDIAPSAASSDRV